MRPALWLSAALFALLITCATAAARGHPPAVREGVVVHVEDGDTIDVRIGDRLERVRYIGIDAPEVPHHDTDGTRGGEAAMRVNRALAGGRRVSLELDAEERDHYGRLLAYVRVGDRMINLEMVRRGYARVLTIRPNIRYERRFEQAEVEARVSGRGLWGSGELGGPTNTASPPVVASSVVSRTRASLPGARARWLTSGRSAAPYPPRGRHGLSARVPGRRLEARGGLRLQAACRPGLHPSRAGVSIAPLHATRRPSAVTEGSPRALRRSGQCSRTHVNPERRPRHPRPPRAVTRRPPDGRTAASSR